QAGSVYTVTFGGTLSTGQQPLLTAAGSANATVAEATVGNNIYTVSFNGDLSGIDLPAMTSTVAGGATATVSTVQNGIAASAAMYIGTLTMDSLRNLYIGTGETDNSTDSFYGTGVYESTDAGVHWNL